MSREALGNGGATFWRLPAACIAVLVPLNWSWHAWMRPVFGSLTLYIMAGSVVYFMLLR